MASIHSIVPNRGADVENSKLQSVSRRYALFCGALALAFFPSLRVFRLARPDVTGNKNVVVLRVYFHDYTNTSRYSLTQVQGFFGELQTLWGTHNSYGKISLTTQVTDLYQLPSNRSSYIDDFVDGDLYN